MGLRFIRQPSDTPNVSNTDDARMIRYAYGGLNGYLQNAGNELSFSIIGNTFRINSGVIVLQGWESEVDSNGWTMAIDNVQTPRYYSVYYEVNLATQGASIKSVYGTADYPVIDDGDDLTALQTGTAKMLLYQFTAQSGVISNVKKIVPAIYYYKELAKITQQLEDGIIIPAESKNTQKINGLSISKNGSNILNLKEDRGYTYVISMRRNLFSNKSYEMTCTKINSDETIGLYQGQATFEANVRLEDKHKYELKVSGLSSNNSIAFATFIFGLGPVCVNLPEEGGVHQPAMATIGLSTDSGGVLTATVTIVSFLSSNLKTLCIQDLTEIWD